MHLESNWRQSVKVDALNAHWTFTKVNVFTRKTATSIRLNPLRSCFSAAASLWNKPGPIPGAGLR